MKASDLRNRVRIIVREKAREISDKIHTGRRIPSIATRIQEYFEKIGLQRVCEYEPDENSFTVLIMPGLQMKVDNETAEKILTLGLP